jgi:hypothetical protein
MTNSPQPFEGIPRTVFEVGRHDGYCCAILPWIHRRATRKSFRQMGDNFEGPTSLLGLDIHLKDADVEDSFREAKTRLPGL